jgi:hypothetical protein
MSHDPYSGNNPNPENPYGDQPPQNPYDPSSQNPYGAPPQQPSGSPPQNPYGAPPQGSYGAPPQNPYGPAPQNPYGPPQGQGYNQWQQPYSEPQNTPLPLGEAIRQLPNQYKRVLTKPSAQTFAEEMGKASWDITWIQLLIYAIIVAILGYLRTLIMPASYNYTGSASALPPSTYQAITAGTSFGLIILIPLFFFIGVGIVYAIAKAFHGTGTFLQQGYTTLLYSVPIGILSSLIGLIPIVGWLVGIAVGIYAIVLNVFAIMAVHRLSGGKATAVVLIPAAVALLFACAVFAFVIVAVMASLRH